MHRQGHEIDRTHTFRYRRTGTLTAVNTSTPDMRGKVTNAFSNSHSLSQTHTCTHTRSLAQTHSRPLTLTHTHTDSTHTHKHTKPQLPLLSSWGGPM